MKLSRQQERALRRHADGVDRATDADRKFFERWPERRHRIRLMSAAERAQHEILKGPLPQQPAGIVWAVVVKRLAPDVRMRIFIGAPDFIAGDEQPETHVRRLWDDYMARHPAVAARETMLTNAVKPEGSLGQLYGYGREPQ